MPKYQGKQIDNLSPAMAHLKGFITLDELRHSEDWINQDFANRHNSTIVYMDGVYKGTATSNMHLSDIISKLMRDEFC